MHPPALAALLATFLDIRAVWRIGLEPDGVLAAAQSLTLLVFADAATLARLHKHTQPREPLELLVVTDGDSFESAWGRDRVAGSLGRCAWRQTSAREAFYDQSQWAPESDAGTVVRVRRKALLLWCAPNSPTGGGERVYKG